MTSKAQKRREYKSQKDGAEGSATGMLPPHLASARLTLNRSGKDDFKLFFGDQYELIYGRTFASGI
jgi:hypothetical protein